MKKRKYIAFSNEGQGGCWWYIYAESPEKIEAVLPEFWIFRETPRRFTDAAHKCAALFTFDIDSPSGRLRDYLENEQQHDWIFKNPSLKGEFQDI